MWPVFTVRPSGLNGICHCSLHSSIANPYIIISLQFLNRRISSSLVCRVVPESVNSGLKNEEVIIMAMLQGLCLVFNSIYLEVLLLFMFLLHQLKRQGLAAEEPEQINAWTTDTWRRADIWSFSRNSRKHPLCFHCTNQHQAKG